MHTVYYVIMEAVTDLIPDEEGKPHYPMVYGNRHLIGVEAGSRGKLGTKKDEPARTYSSYELDDTADESSSKSDEGEREKGKKKRVRPTSSDNEKPREKLKHPKLTKILNPKPTAVDQKGDKESTFSEKARIARVALNTNSSLLHDSTQVLSKDCEECRISSEGSSCGESRLQCLAWLGESV